MKVSDLGTKNPRQTNPYFFLNADTIDTSLSAQCVRPALPTDTPERLPAKTSTFASIAASQLNKSLSTCTHRWIYRAARNCLAIFRKIFAHCLCVTVDLAIQVQRFMQVMYTDTVLQGMQKRDQACRSRRRRRAKRSVWPAPSFRTYRSKQRSTTVISLLRTALKSPEQCIRILYFTRDRYSTILLRQIALICAWVICPVWTCNLLQTLSETTRHHSSHRDLPGTASHEYNIAGGSILKKDLTIDLEMTNQDDDSQNCDKSPCTIRFSTLRPRDMLTGDRAPTDIYHEHQVGVFCQIHALHALIGQPLIHWQDINAHIGELAARNPLLQHSIGYRGYSDEAINIYLKDFATPSIFMAHPPEESGWAQRN